MTHRIGDLISIGMLIGTMCLSGIALALCAGVLVAGAVGLMTMQGCRRAARRASAAFRPAARPIVAT